MTSTVDRLDAGSSANDWLGTESGVNRAVYYDTDLYRLEQERIWSKTWVFIGFEAEVPNPGDFMTKTFNEVPLILVRDRHGDVRVLENSCSHRGSMVEMRRCGNARRFTCPYHRWSFGTDGDLLGVPSVEGAEDDAHFDKAEHPLAQYPRVETHAGLIFVCSDSEAPPLVEYLSGAAPLIAEILRGGSYKILGSNTVMVRGNWKLFVENGSDSYHGPFLHRAMAAARTYVSGHVQAFGNGHGMIQWVARDIDEDAFEQRAGFRLEHPDVFKHHFSDAHDHQRVMTIFPNLTVTNHYDCFNVISAEPVGVGKVRITRTALAGVDDSVEVRSRRAEQMAHTFLAGGIQLLDDMLQVDWVQRGMRAEGIDAVDLTRGLGSDEGNLDSEASQRNFYRQWLRLMRGQSVVSDRD